jgi:hypothetical protein
MALEDTDLGGGGAGNPGKSTREGADKGRPVGWSQPLGHPTALTVITDH